MTREQREHLEELLERIKSRHTEKYRKNYGDRTLREVQTFEDVTEALELLKGERAAS